MGQAATVSSLTGAFSSRNSLAVYPELIFAIIKIHLAQDVWKRLVFIFVQTCTTWMSIQLLRKEAISKGESILVPTSFPQTGIQVFMKKQSTCTYASSHILMKDTKVNHFADNKQAKSLFAETLTFNPKWSIKEIASIAASWFHKFQLLQQTQSSLIFYILIKVTRHGNTCLEVNSKTWVMTNVASSSDILRDFCFLNVISPLITKITPRWDTDEQKCINTKRTEYG